MKWAGLLPFARLVEATSYSPRMLLDAKCAGKGGGKKIGGRVEGGKKLRERVLPGSRRKQKIEPCTSLLRQGRLGLIGFGKTDCMHAASRGPYRPQAWPTTATYRLRQARQGLIGFAKADRRLSAWPTPRPYYFWNCTKSGNICGILFKKCIIKKISTIMSVL